MVKKKKNEKMLVGSKDIARYVRRPRSGKSL
jgi:hypothetical protein